MVVSRRPNGRKEGRRIVVITLLDQLRAVAILCAAFDSPHSRKKLLLSLPKLVNIDL